MSKGAKDADADADVDRPRLLPCPFCGSADVDPKFSYFRRPAEEGGGTYGHEPGCNACGASAPAEIWNRRQSLSQEAVRDEAFSAHHDFDLERITLAMVQAVDDEYACNEKLRIAYAHDAEYRRRTIAAVHQRLLNGWIDLVIKPLLAKYHRHFQSMQRIVEREALKREPNAVGRTAIERSKVVRTCRKCKTSWEAPVNFCPQCGGVNDEMVDRFLSWPLPESVCADLCATKQGLGRIGTNLLSATEAKQMLEYVLAHSYKTVPASGASDD